ncbi:MAG: hypothetical protein ABIO57_01205 [Candidatus Paceibacterota bacterium]
MNTTEEEKIRVTSHGGSEGRICIEGFSPENMERMLAAMTSGAYFVKVEKGKFIAIPIWEELPKPTEDIVMTPFWRKHTEALQPEMFDEYEHSPEKGCSPSISISSLCGYHYSEENYKYNAEQLESFGFICMRSRRGIDAKFWEIWHLPGLWSAKGILGANIQSGKDNNEKLLIALEFLRHKVSFGTLDVSNQRLAMAGPD